MTSTENIIFYKLLRRDAPMVIVEAVDMRFYPIEIAFQLEKGFLLFDGTTFKFCDQLEPDAGFEDITELLEPADQYRIERIEEMQMDSRIHLSDGHILLIRQAPYENDAQMRSWLDVTLPDGSRKASDIEWFPYDARPAASEVSNKTGILKKLFRN